MRYLKEHHETNGQKLEKAGSRGIIVIFSNKVIPVKKKNPFFVSVSLSLSLLLDGRKAQEKEDFCTQCMPTTWNEIPVRFIPAEGNGNRDHWIYQNE